MKRYKKRAFISIGTIFVLGLVIEFIVNQRPSPLVKQMVRETSKTTGRKDSVMRNFFQGQGYFDVTADSAHPLVLDMGKEWCVVACRPAVFVAKRGSDSVNQISVLNGSVLVFTHGSGIKVDAGFEINNARARKVIQNPDTTTSTAEPTTH